MAARRGKSQARRNSSPRGGMPGWAWLVLGLVLGVGAIWLAPRPKQAPPPGGGH